MRARGEPRAAAESVAVIAAAPPVPAGDLLAARALPYEPDSAAVFERLLDLPAPVFLDSGGARRGRYDILAAAPSRVIRGLDDAVEIVARDGARTTRGGDPFAALRETLQMRRLAMPPAAAPGRAAAHAPTQAQVFSTGLVGYFGYDFGRRIERLPSLAARDDAPPLFLFGLYDWALVVDHRRRRSELLVWRDAALDAADIDALCERLAAPAAGVDAAFEVGALAPNMTRADYLDKVAAIKAHIRAGDCYQVNFAQRFSAPLTGAGWGVYRALRRLNPAPCSAFLRIDDVEVMSISPESFLRVAGGRVETRPIKGTRARSADPVADRAAAAALARSAKDRAENLMIVDLLRNDLGRSCRFGSVRAARLFEVESFANVHHLVSAVTGELAPGRDMFDLLRGCFPGGSITGAPKVRAMEIIEALEPHRRGVYCGAIGCAGRGGDMRLNVAIRTAVYRRGRLAFYAGGGIVDDSVAADEYQETLDKLSSFFECLGAPPG